MSSFFIWRKEMGWFSSKKKTTAYIATQSMLEDSDFKSSREYAMQDYLFSTNKPDLTETLIKYQNNSTPRKFKRVISFAKAPDGYVFGLPTTSKLVDKKKSLTDLLVAYLSTQESSAVSILYSVIGDKDFNHYAWLKLVSTYGYNGKTNELTALYTQKGTPCYLYTGKIIYSDRSNKEYEIIRVNNSGLLGFDYGQCFNRIKDMRKIVSYELGTTDSFVFSYQYKNASGTVTESITVDMSDVNPPPKTEKYYDMEDFTHKTREVYENEPDFIQAAYLVNDEVKFFNYEYLSGNTTLDNNIDFDEGMGTYFPRLYLRINQKDMVDSQDARYKAHTNKYCRALGLNLEDITKKVKEGIGDNLDSTRDIYISMVARPNVNLNDQLISKYLYNYFEDLYKASVKEYGDYKRRPVSLDVSDNVASQSISCNGIIKRINVGVAKNKDNALLKKGEYCITRFLDLDTNAILKRGWAHSFIYQITDDKYITVDVYNLESKANVKGHTAHVSNDSDELFVPLDLRIVGKLSQLEQEQLFHKCLHIQITLLKVTKVKWYQRGAFKLVVAAIGIAISFFTAGAGTPIATILINAAINTAVGMAISIAVSALIKLAIKLGLDIETATLLATVAEIAMLAYSKGQSSITLRADKLMETVNIAFNNYQKSVNVKMTQLQNEFNRLAKEFKDKYEELDEVRKSLLTKSVPLSLDLLLDKQVSDNRYQVNLGETPEDFYTRSMFFDVTGLDVKYINNYVELSTQLPSFTDNYKKYKQQQQKQPLDIQSSLLV